MFLVNLLFISDIFFVSISFLHGIMCHLCLLLDFSMMKWTTHTNLLFISKCDCMRERLRLSAECIIAQSSQQDVHSSCSRDERKSSRACRHCTTNVKLACTHTLSVSLDWNLLFQSSKLLFLLVQDRVLHIMIFSQNCSHSPKVYFGKNVENTKTEWSEMFVFKAVKTKDRQKHNLC